MSQHPPPPPQRPTCMNMRVDSTDEAHAVFEAVSRDMLPLITRRLDPDERDEIVRPGSVFVWEERDPLAQATGEGMERWTDGRRWGPSRNRDGFLVYQEDVSPPGGSAAPTDEVMRNRLTKRSYSANVFTANGRRKWHLVSYFTQSTYDRLVTIDADPALRALRAQIPPGKFTSARGTARNARDAPAASAHFCGLLPADPGPSAFMSASMSMAVHPIAANANANASSSHPAPIAPPPSAFGPGPPASAPAPIVQRAILAAPLAPAPAPAPVSARGQPGARRRGSPELPPLRYSQRIPYAPRSDADSVALRALNSACAL